MTVIPAVRQQFLRLGQQGSNILWSVPLEELLKLNPMHRRCAAVSRRPQIRSHAVPQPGQYDFRIAAVLPIVRSGPILTDDLTGRFYNESVPDGYFFNRKNCVSPDGCSVTLLLAPSSETGNVLMDHPSGSAKSALCCSVQPVSEEGQEMTMDLLVEG